MHGDAPLPLDDRGLAYGDGLFETILVRDGQAYLWEQHVARLLSGCRRLGIPTPSRHQLDRLPAGAGPGLRVLKLLMTRGSGGRGYRPPATPTPRLRWQYLPFTPSARYWHDGVRVRHCALRLSIQPLLAGLKHLNRLENVLARREWSGPEVAEGLLSDQAGRLIEATSMNVFWRREGRWETPSLEGCGVAGTLRRALIEQLSIVETDVTVELLPQVESLCLGNSVQGVWPVIRLDDTEGEQLAAWRITAEQRRFQNAAQRLLGHPLQPMVG